MLGPRLHPSHLQTAQRALPLTLMPASYHHYSCSLCRWPKCEHIEGPTDFSFQTQFLQFIWISSNKIQLKINIFHTLALKLWNKLYYIWLVEAFQQHKKCFKIPIQFSVSILFSFHWINGSIINSFHIIAPNNLKPSQCTHAHWELSKVPRVWHEAPWFGRSHNNKTKQTTFCFLDRYSHLQVVYNNNFRVF
jgi:hypothetical protein